jgi:hypothetical protein
MKDKHLSVTLLQQLLSVIVSHVRGQAPSNSACPLKRHANPEILASINKPLFPAAECLIPRYGLFNPYRGGCRYQVATPHPVSGGSGCRVNGILKPCACSSLS